MINCFISVTPSFFSRNSKPSFNRSVAEPGVYTWSAGRGLDKRPEIPGIEIGGRGTYFNYSAVHPLAPPTLPGPCSTVPGGLPD